MAPAAGGLVSNAALCTLTASSASVMEGDVVLKLVLHLASDRQVKVQVAKQQQKQQQKNSLTLSWGLHSSPSTGTATSSGTSTGNSNSSTTTMLLTQRAAILRALAGPFLHYALDDTFLGGHGAAAAASCSNNNNNQKAILAMASLTSWMTVADQVKHDGNGNGNGNHDDTVVASVLKQLETHLETRAFLIPSSQATLADMDLCVALLQKMTPDTMHTMTTTTPNVLRWITTVHAQMKILLGGAGDDAAQEYLPPLPPTLVTTQMPMFFYGTESFTPVVSGKLPPTQKQQPAGAATTTKTTTMTTSSTPVAVAVAGAGAGAGAVGLSDEEKQAAADKRAAKKAAAASKKNKTASSSSSPAAAADTILDITALDIRIGKILKAWHHPDSDKLFCEEVDVGEDKPRLIASGLRAFYTTQDLVNRHVLVLCNLKSRNLAGFPSHGMVLCASNGAHDKVEFVGPVTTTSSTSTDIVIGERVLFGTLMGTPEPENKVAKKKMVEQLLPHLGTNAQGVVVYNTTTLGGGGGEHAAHTMTHHVPIQAVNQMAHAHVG